MMLPLFIPCCSSMLKSEWALREVGNVDKLAMNGFNIKRDRQLKTKCVQSSSMAVQLCRFKSRTISYRNQ